MIEELIKFKESKNLSWYRIAKDLNIPVQTIFNWRKSKYQMSPVYKKIITEYINK